MPTLFSHCKGLRPVDSFLLQMFSQEEILFCTKALLLGPQRVPSSQRHGSSCARFSKGILPKMALN